MTYVAKRANIRAVSAKVESTYGTEAAPDVSTDGVLLQAPGDAADTFPDNYEFPGDAGDNSIGLFPQANIAPSGRSSTYSLPMYARGGGAAYSASVVPVNGLHTMLKSCGLTATSVVTGGSESWGYVAHGDGTTPTSLTLNAWDRQVLGASNLTRRKIFGGMSSLKIDAPNLAPPVFTFEGKGISGGDEAEASFTLPTFVSAPVIPGMAGATFTIDGTALNLLAWNFDQGREVESPRVPQTASNGHLGFVAGIQKPMLKVTIEQALLATWNPFTKRGSAATAAIVLNWGSVQYNRAKFAAATAQIVNVKDGRKGKAATWDIDLKLIPSTLGGVDAWSLTFD